MAPLGSRSGFEVRPSLLWSGIVLVTAGLVLSVYYDNLLGDTFSTFVNLFNLVLILVMVLLYLLGQALATATLGIIVYASAINFILELGQTIVLGSHNFALAIIYPAMGIVIFTAVAGFVLHRLAGLIMGTFLTLIIGFAAYSSNDPWLLDNYPVLLLSLLGFSAVLYQYRVQLEHLVYDLKQARIESETNRARLAERDLILKQYVNPSVLEVLDNANLHDHKRSEVTVVFIDICEFTRLAESLPPEPVAELLNCYFDEVASETLRHGGEIDKFIGDAALLVFKGNDHLLRAWQATCAMFARIRTLEGKPLWNSEPYPGVSAGLHSGWVIEGTFGSRSYRRWDYTVIGDVVNTASRLESCAHAGQILMTRDTHDTLSQDLINQKLPPTAGVFLQTILLKNKSIPTEIWNVLP